MGRFLVAAVCLVLFAGLGFAQDKPANRLAKLLNRFDLNGDGQLDQAERDAIRRWLKETGLGGERPQPLPQTLFPDKVELYKAKAGPYYVDLHETFELRDEKRDKVIPLRINWPAEAKGPCPLIIFCHGALGSKDGADPLAKHWTSHGYIVIRPTFGDSLSLMSDKEKLAIRSHRQLLASDWVTKQWDQRPMDVKHVIDSLDLIQQQVKAIAGKIDTKRIAVAGHSYGAHTTMLLSGLILEAPQIGKAPSFADDRIKAFVAISPQGPGRTIHTRALAKMAGPMLVITGDNDGSPMPGEQDKKGAWRRQVFDHAAPGDRYLLWVKDAYHGLGGINGDIYWNGAGPVAPDQVLLVESTTMAFFDAYLKDDAKAKAYLAGDQVDGESNGLATLTAK